jgi:hypothetical protein
LCRRSGRQEFESDGHHQLGRSTTLWHYHQAGATREMIHVWLFDNPTGSFSTGIGGKAGLAIAMRELESGVPATTAAP